MGYILCPNTHNCFEAAFHVGAFPLQQAPRATLTMFEQEPTITKTFACLGSAQVKHFDGSRWVARTPLGPLKLSCLGRKEAEEACQFHPQGTPPGWRGLAAPSSCGHALASRSAGYSHLCVAKVVHVLDMLALGQDVALYPCNALCDLSRCDFQALYGA